MLTYFHKMMWEYLADHPELEKNSLGIWKVLDKAGIEIPNNCWACYGAIQNYIKYDAKDETMDSVANKLFYDAELTDIVCNLHCPLRWPINAAGERTCSNKGLYTQWVYSEDLVERTNLALQIRDLDQYVHISRHKTANEHIMFMLNVIKGIGRSFFNGRK